MIGSTVRMITMNITMAIIVLRRRLFLHQGFVESSVDSSSLIYCNYLSKTDRNESKSPTAISWGNETRLATFIGTIEGTILIRKVSIQNESWCRKQKIAYISANADGSLRIRLIKYRNMSIKTGHTRRNITVNPPMRPIMVVTM